MKYKRERAKPTGKTGIDSVRKTKRRASGGIRSKATLTVIVISVCFSLTRLGILNTSALKEYISDYGRDDSFNLWGKNETVNKITGKAGELIREFCYGYLRNEKGSLVYAESNDVIGGVEENTSPEQRSPDIKNSPEQLSDPAGENDEAAPEKTETEYEKKSFMPVSPCDGEITSPFGERIHPVDMTKSVHNGVDIACAEGTGVRAVYEGIVEKAEYNQFSGNYVVVKHIDGFTSSYAHLSKIYVTEGQSVTTGTEIGASGSTGKVTGPHLHFEIRCNGEAVNPYMYIR